MVTRKKKELDIEIPPVNTKLKLSKPSIEKLKTPPAEKATSKKESTVNAVTSSEANSSVNELQTQFVEMNAKLDKLNEMIYSSDWKLWKIMIMIEMIAKENGYAFTVHGGADKHESIEKDGN